MGNCRFCGHPAGFFRSQHHECAEARIRGEREVVELVSKAPFLPAPDTHVAERVKALATDSFIGAAERLPLCARGWAAAVDRALHEGVISEEQESRLVDVAKQLALPRAALDSNGSFERVVKSAVIRDLLNGRMPTRMTLEGMLNLSLQKREQVVWVFQNVDLLEDRIYRQYVGGSSGVSIRVAKGIYYHVGAFTGEAINRTERVHADTGLMAATNKHLYFAGPQRSLRIPYSKIVSFQPFADGLGITRDAASAKLQLFVTGDGWFTYNLVANLAHL